MMDGVHDLTGFHDIETPGWKFGWTWEGDEVIWDIRGAETTEEGNCSRFRGDRPHSCERSPVTVDLLPGAPYQMQTKNCCRGGVLSSITQDETKYMASFQMSVGTNGSTATMPSNFSIGIPGYTCSNATAVPPTKFSSPNTRHRTQALLTWQVTCSYSQFRESVEPTCCVSLSTFYNNTIISCPHCSCGCQEQKTSKCTRDGKLPDFVRLIDNNDNELSADPILTCAQHMCPTRVHWHVKASYKQYWRVKVTITNFNLVKNYSDWNLVMQHPNLRSLEQVFSFNYKPLVQYGSINDTAMFWGVKYYNEMLLQQGELGNVQSEMLFSKDPDIFTFQAGWPYPRTVLFNGHECVMPSPNAYPSLPSRISAATSINHRLLLILVFTMFLFL